MVTKVFQFIQLQKWFGRICKIPATEYGSFNYIRTIHLGL